MPRHRRLDIPVAIYHVIRRGIERRDIFTADNDREEFLVGLQKLLRKQMRVGLTKDIQATVNNFKLIS